MATGEVLRRDRWEFWRGAGLPGAGTAAGVGTAAGAGAAGAWTSDESAAVSVMHFPKMLGMNQVNYHKPSGRHLLANYAFIDPNGQPRPWHQQPQVLQHRTQLTFFEAEQPWGPFSAFHRDDDWQSPDGAGGAYCPVFPPKWMGATSALVVSASCCARTTGAIPASTLRHYNFSAQRVQFSYNPGWGASSGAK